MKFFAVHYSAGNSMDVRISLRLNLHTSIASDIGILVAGQNRYLLCTCSDRAAKSLLGLLQRHPQFHMVS